MSCWNYYPTDNDLSKKLIQQHQKYCKKINTIKCGLCDLQLSNYGDKNRHWIEFHQAVPSVQECLPTTGHSMTATPKIMPKIIQPLKQNVVADNLLPKYKQAINSKQPNDFNTLIATVQREYANLNENKAQHADLMINLDTSDSEADK